MGDLPPETNCFRGFRKEQPTDSKVSVTSATMNEELQGQPEGSVDDAPSQEVDQPQEGQESPVETQDQPQSPDSELFDWGGRRVTAKELYQESTGLLQEFTRRSQRLAELEKAPKEQPKDPSEGLTPEERIQYEEAAKRLAPMLTPNLQSLVDTMVQERLNSTMEQEKMKQQIETQFTQIEDLAKKASIPFNRHDLVEYMQKTRNADIESAFRAKYFDQLVDYNISQRQAKKKEVYTERGTKAATQPIAPEPKSLTDQGYRKSLSDKLRNMMGQ